MVEGLLANSLEIFLLAIGQVKISSMLYSLAVIALIMNRWLILKDRKPYLKSKESAPSGFTGKIIHSLVYIRDIFSTVHSIIAILSYAYTQCDWNYYFSKDR